ncbi:UDP-2-acetamido-3-amino-2,3-dideoxy-glucuronate N-acetyltransferase [Hymenobacter luteus]|uniref:UDP-2-acetamido-3-amino-2,3-dideoxy-glucuronate N-acetyltransferase n=2 Tax=Hymenobacter TaxID=89966 RepID=A0A7W9T3E6_9BACT|nr:MULTISPECIES: acyltransferase [Hymenobacter]MBB4603191.1 UDP-2-acetamido-3-amino-2,3-dideoxy-glucuronate N-acetyltransferase [Hymenobacter latericoloratus]MBB6060089.1 UDP-2-acetamido-3-amino-2,3-dideoxy-glucuronate N-acetyltransferase [Hymenobacter luteus]
MPDASDYYAHPTAVLDEGCRIGAGCRIWHFCHVSAGAELGPDCSLGQNVFVAEGVMLGRNVKVQNNVSLYSGVTCADDVFIGPSAVFTNVLNPRAAVPRRGAGHYQPTRLGQGVSIGANSTIVCGVSLGEYAFVGAGSVVTRDVAPYALVYGNPARHRGWLSTHGRALRFGDDGRATCPESQEQYQLTDGLVSRISPG